MSDPKPIANETVNTVVEQALRGEVPRREFLRRLVIAGLTSSAAYQLVNETTASAQTGGASRITTFALGEEGQTPRPPQGVKPSVNPPTNRMTTYAVGEEGGKPTTMAVGEEGTPKPTPSPGVTTKAFGEESGVRPQPTTLAVGEEGIPQPKPIPNPGVTTRAVGEEGTPKPYPTPKPGITTQALGEEGSPSPWPTPQPRITTQAIGEEGTTKQPVRKNPSGFLQNLPRPWRNFRRW